MSSDVTPFDPVERVNDALFEAEIDKLISYAEDLRIGLIRKHRTRNNLATAAFILLVLGGSLGFGYFLFFKGRIDIGVICVMISIALSFSVHLWAEKPLEEYKQQYKHKFMPKLAKLLGGLRFYPARGIGRKVLSKTGVLPKFESYKAEDCFMGEYKGVKVIFSEARLFASERSSEPVFDGIFVLLEAPRGVFDSHTILTSDHRMIQSYASKRWQKLQAVNLPPPPEGAEHFRAYSSNPESAGALINERLLKELAEASQIFNEAPITTVMFRKKYIFMMIPYAQDMFEASNLHVPVKTRQHAQQCRHEINQILEIIDVFNLFREEREQGDAPQAVPPTQPTQEQTPEAPPPEAPQADTPPPAQPAPVAPPPSEAPATQQPEATPAAPSPAQPETPNTSSVAPVHPQQPQQQPAEQQSAPPAVPPAPPSDTDETP
jgi:hypothetical protein